MATKIIGLISILMLLSACSLIAPATPSINQLETGVFQTLTALPTSSVPSSIPVINTPPPVQATATLPPLVNTPAPTSTVPSNPPAYPVTPAPNYSPQYADQFIYFYYNNINMRNYALTWSLLTDNFKFANNSAAEGGFLGYANFWDTVKRVDIFGVTITSLNGAYAVVSVNMQYNYKNGTVVPSLQPFNLVYDSARGTWLFNSFTAVTPPPSSPVISQTPQQFINSYFSNVNAGNLIFTWTLLTDQFKINANHNSYTDYTDFWNSVSQVNVTAISIVSELSSSAVVDVSLVFNYRSGLVSSTTVRYNLIYDSIRSTWLFDSSL